MTPPTITFTLDLEDHRPDDRAELRFPRPCPAGSSTTSPDPRGAGHGLHRRRDRSLPPRAHLGGRRGATRSACTAWRRVPHPTSTPRRSATRPGGGHELLEDLTGTAVAGFRAPTYSLVRTTTWATDILADLGFTYSSSVLPGHNPLFGYPEAPRRPFRWPSGLVELPSPVAGVGRWQVPYLGGVYLRALPWRAVLAAAEAEASTPVPFTYVHPYDPDVAEPFWWVPETGPLSPLLWVGRRTTLDRLDRLAHRAGPPLVERLAELGDLATFHPGDHHVPLSSDPPTGTAHERASAGDAQFAQDLMVHRLPPATLVDRISWLTDAARGNDVIHVGFVKAGSGPPGPIRDLAARAPRGLGPAARRSRPRRGRRRRGRRGRLRGVRGRLP